MDEHFACQYLTDSEVPAPTERRDPVRQIPALDVTNSRDPVQSRHRNHRCSKEAVMACACEKDRGKGNKCAWCKEAIANGIPVGSHKCSSFGKCS